MKVYLIVKSNYLRASMNAFKTGDSFTVPDTDFGW
ncbi:hypothetical protein Pan97_32870 [Bremerella volcania]|uniref:Uncharacterized protein n=1 Tax=Bremerella volcania TaxID=2527984 RepID=A0A518CAI6_9BACT|nr:hypothetical protein Pan97_32870 [Bremerella volcania]